MDELYPLDWSLDSASVAKASVTAENARLQDCEQPPAPSSHSSNSLHIYCLQALVQNRLSQLDVEVCPSHSELSSFVDWIGWSDTDRQYLPTYLLLGNCWKGPQRMLISNTLHG